MNQERKSRPAPSSASVAPRRAKEVARLSAPRLGGALAAIGGCALLFVALATPVRGEEPGTPAADLRSVGIAPLAVSADQAIEPSAAVEHLVAAPARRAVALPAAIAAASPAVAGPITEVRIRGRLSYGIDEALRLSAVSEETRGAFARLFASRLNLARDVGPDDHFDLVLATRAGGTEHKGALLYAAIDRAGASDIRLMKWRSGSGTTWIDAAAADQSPRAMRWPVSGRISSGFGLRYHPILHFARMHRGIDFAAGSGSPIVAASDGVVTGAGWAGGYGRQVRIAHADGLVTTYSHLSRLSVSPGTPVRSGQMIGAVGSSGLSTGPHLHYEVYRGGRPINPLSARFIAASPLDRADQERFRAQLTHYMRLAALRPGRA